MGGEMNVRQWKYIGPACGLLALGLIAGGAPSAHAGPDHAAHHAEQAQQESTDWQAVAQALGKPGTMMPGDVYRIGMPRSDLNVTVEGTPVKAGFALGSYAAFRQEGAEDDDVMVMGDLVLLDEEVPAVMSSLMQNGISVTAVHNHLNQVSPHVLYMHYVGTGYGVDLATKLHQALATSGTPLDGSPAAAPPDTIDLDTGQIDSILGRSGRIQGGGIYQVNAPRAETIAEMGMELLPAMGVVTSLNFQPTGGGRAAITGDFVLLGSEVNPVASALRQNGIEVTAIHNHAQDDDPRLFYKHFWANDDALKLARGLRAAADQTNAKAP
jgi:hypothetical protein